ncbi:MAG: carboxypeptidase regulatory-like domain-containing protein [Acidobacteria bacterium]|nr:carboxypeptidase regulatory-like domain-containing protein [Acidobacteriota bacterium]
MTLKKVLYSLVLTVASSVAFFAQTTGSISGVVSDQNGARVPNASVTVKSQAGQEFTVTSDSNGLFRVPALGAGFYTVTGSAKDFKTTIVEGVKVDVGTPTTVEVVMVAGAVSETVTVTGGGEVLQTQTAAINTTIVGRQITQTPIASRDALDLVLLMPGTATVGAPRRSSVNGLPKGSLEITIDGVNVQDNLLRSSDGYFTYVRPRVDAIDEVTVSTANPGAESGGDGAVQIKFVTRRGTNRYTGGLFAQNRNDVFNSAYWYNNRDLKPLPGSDKAPRNRINLNQYGGRFGGPLPFPHFGEGGPFFHSGKDRLFFFVNYEQFRQPESQTRQRTILTPDAQAGIFKWIVGSNVNQVNLFTLAAANSQLSTADPTVSTVLAAIRTAVGSAGTTQAITNAAGAVTDPNRLLYSFTPSGLQVRKFMALRFDANLNKSNSLEVVINRQKFVPSKDFLNSQEERFPGLPWYTQGSDRNSWTAALRTSFGGNIVNEARYAVSYGLSAFSPGISAADFAYQGGFALGIDAAGITTPTSRNSYSDRNTPVFDFTDSVTFQTGNHSISFGGQIKLIKYKTSSIGRIVPIVGFGLDSTDSSFGMFSATNLPGASATQLTEARNLYATLIGRVLSLTATAYLTADNNYQVHAEQAKSAKQYSYGLYAQDSWKMSSQFTLNFGLRWQLQTAFRTTSTNWARLESNDQVWGLSGVGNIFKPGTLTGTVPRVVAAEKGEKAYPDDWNNYAPTVGAVWSPNFGSKGLMRTIFGGRGSSVFRGGYSISFVREGFNLLESILGANPGGNLSASRSLAIGNLTVGTNLRTPGNPNLVPAAFSATPAYPLTLTTANSTNAFSPDLKTGAVHSFSFGYQREIDKNTVIEVRYVGNRGKALQRQYNLNEFNMTENGFADEFLLAQQNLYANISAGRGNSFAYFGPGTGTNPLPIMISYFNGAATNNPTLPANYAAASFTNTTLVAALSRNNPNPLAFSGTSFENSAARRANAAANGRPINFFYVNPSTGVNGSFIIDNTNNTWYDSAVIEFRRRLSQGLRIQASYVFSKAMSDAFQSSSVVFAGYTQRPNGLELARNYQAFDLRHQFKFDATYDLPMGKGKTLFGNANWFVNGIVGGWTVLPTVRWQSGSPFSFGNVQLVGMTVKELQKAIGVYKGGSVVNYLPDDIILNTQRAFDINVANTTSNGGYGTQFGTGGPTGRFLAPAGYGNCVQKTVGDCGFNNLVVYGPGFFKFDVSVTKKFTFGETRNIELRAIVLDALNKPNFRVGGWGVDTVVAGVGGATFGQLANGSAYQDISTTNDPGGRIIDFMIRFNF